MRNAWRRKNPLIGKAFPCSWRRIPILPGPLLEVSCLYAPFRPLTPAPASCQKEIYLHTDDINMLAASVRHNYKYSSTWGCDVSKGPSIATSLRTWHRLILSKATEEISNCWKWKSYSCLYCSHFRLVIGWRERLMCMTQMIIMDKAEVLKMAVLYSHQLLLTIHA